MPGSVCDTDNGAHLDLDREEEGRGEGVDGGDTGDRARLIGGGTGLQVPVGEGQEPPDHGEEHPGAKKGRGEDEEGVLPLQVHHGGEHILQEATLEHTEVETCIFTGAGGKCPPYFTVLPPCVAVDALPWVLPLRLSSLFAKLLGP